MEEFQKVSVGLSGVIHLSRMVGHKTLCGRWWWADNNHGLTYCRSCQSSLSRLTKRAPDACPVWADGKHIWEETISGSVCRSCGKRG